MAPKSRHPVTAETAPVRWPAYGVTGGCASLSGGDTGGPREGANGGCRVGLWSWRSRHTAGGHSQGRGQATGGGNSQAALAKGAKGRRQPKRG